MSESRHSLLVNLLAALSGLESCLAEESCLLTEARVDDLPPLTRRKTELLDQVAVRWRDLGRHLGLQANASPAVLDEILARGSPPETLALWRQVMERSQAIHRQNQLNGKLIQEQLRHAHAASQVLREAANRGGLYDADGQSLALFGGSRSIDQV